MFIKMLGLAAAVAIAANGAALAQRTARAPVFTPPYDIIDEGAASAPPVHLASLPGAYYAQQQPGYPQSPPGGGY